MCEVVDIALAALDAQLQRLRVRISDHDLAAQANTGGDDHTGPGGPVVDRLAWARHHLDESLRLGFRHLRLSHDLAILAAELDGGRHGTDSPEQGKAGGKSVGGEPLGSSVRGGVGP